MEYELKAIEEAPKGAETTEGLALLGTRVADEILAGRRSMEEAKQLLYDRLLALYTHDAPTPAKPPFKGASTAHLNVMQVKGDALGTNVMGTMLAKPPYCVAMAGFDGDRLRRNVVAERAVQFFVDKGHAKHSMAEVSRDAFLYNVGPLYTGFKTKGDGFDPTPGVEYCPIEAFDFVLYPPSVAANVWKDPVKLVGHRIWVRRGTCDARKKSGEYADVPVQADQPEGVRQAQEQSTTKHIPHDSAGRKENDLLPLWWVCFKDLDAAGVEVWWWGLLSEHDKQFLRLRRHKEPRPPYHVFRYKANKGEFWSKSTVGNDLQGVQLEINNLYRMWLDGVKWNIYGTAVGQSYGKAEQHLQLEPGAMVLLDNPSDAQYWNPQADLAYVPEALQTLLSYADQIVRISQEFTGGESEDSTATQAAIRQAGMRAGVDDYISTAAMALVSLYEYTHSLIVNNLDAWWDDFAEFLGFTDEDRARLEEPVMWVPHTQGIGSTPGVQVQLLQMVMESIAVLGAPVDKRKLADLMLVQVERMGLAGASDLMLPESPDEIIQTLGQMLGIDPLVLSDFVMKAQEVQQMAQQGEQNDERAKFAEAVAKGVGGVDGAPGDQGPPLAYGRAAGAVKKGA